MHIKYRLRRNFLPTRLAKITKLDIVRFWKECGEKETFSTARGKAHWHHHFEKCVCCTAEHTQSCDPATPDLEK